ncbi:tRNA wybutosine-synthesizing protein 5-like [Aplysia californica]|uniref:tRNA wybutosine-synthesizing protein 5-like n=1 Tax=Aplysia californica TaxID=6500 RepID=A0ABM1W4Q6_APLCA|nr:tRNA wybutosine-synthesizing protein 5-like [Aplysia californica]
MDNILLQIVGSKKVVLFAPSDADFLYMNGDKSEILDMDSPDLERFPLFSGATPYRGYLYPGDMLFIPGMCWFSSLIVPEGDLNAFENDGDCVQKYKVMSF